MNVRCRVVSLCLFLFLAPGAMADSAPHEVAGFVLGKEILAHADRVKMDSALPIRYEPYLVEVEAAPCREFKSGLIATGQCDRPGKILRIKMKYADGSREYFERLLKAFKERFGPPSEWRGDPFHIVKAWKWAFVDDRGERISLILQHNALDQEEKMGNSVKLTLTSQVDRERECHLRRGGAVETEAEVPPAGSPDWEKCIPR